MGSSMPNMDDLDRRIRQRVDAFVEELTELIREAALESVKEALGGAAKGSAPKPKRAPRAVAKKAAGGKRSAAELARFEQAIVELVQKNPGTRADQIAKTLGVATKDVALPMKKLMSRGELSSEGQRRATRYYPGTKKR